MRKVKLDVEETLKYRREITAVMPDDMTDDQLESILDNAQREGSISEFVYYLKKRGVSFPEGYDDDLNSPDDCEVECWEYDIDEEDGSA